MFSSVIRFSFLVAACSIILAPDSALAHHAMGGETPSNSAQGLIAGLAHPVIGFDHLAFIIAVGAAASFTQARFLTPLAFVLATLAGCLLQLQGVALPGAEIVIAASVVFAGALLLSGAPIPGGAYVALFAVSGMFHGWAYGQSIVGAEQTPLISYLIGFSAIQYLIALTVMIGISTIWQRTGDVRIRILGGAIAGFGMAFLVENIESMLLPGVA